MRNSMKRLAGLAAVGAVLAAAGGADASIFSYSNDFSVVPGAEWTFVDNVYNQQPGILGALSNNGPGSATLTATSSGASAANGGTLSFDLLAFGSIDGVNCCTDVFTLIVNGATLFEAAFSMGGGGGETIFTNPNGATVSGSGSIRTISIAFTALTGANTFSFGYPALQGGNDEGFGLDNVSLRAEVTPPDHGPGVPEPATWAMMLAGFLGTGAVLRSRRRTAFAA